MQLKDAAVSQLLGAQEPAAWETLNHSITGEEMKNQKENSKRFLEAFNRIEGKFRSLLKSGKGTPLVRLVNEAPTHRVPWPKKRMSPFYTLLTLP